jgi:hypothetical protein
MVSNRIIFRDRRLFVKCKDISLDIWREIQPGDIKNFQRWVSSYQDAVKKFEREKLILNLGKEIYSWLNQTFEGFLGRLCRDIPAPPLFIEFTVPAQPGEDELLFLEVPWEILANESGHLAATRLKYTPVRRFGTPGTLQEPSQYRLSMVFMAAAPRSSVSLNYEAEENAILQAVGQTGIDMSIEESGNLELLSERLFHEKPVDVLHVSCHGNNQPHPLLQLESQEGEEVKIEADAFAAEIGRHTPRLLFVSACLTSEPNKFLNSFSSILIRNGFPAVLGWAGSVSDSEATEFASQLYHFLSKSHSLREALSLSRYRMLNPDENSPRRPSRDWHLARLYLGNKGGGVLSGSNRARSLRRTDYGHKEFLDEKGKNVPVASRREFVGRRRQIQDILREFRTPEHGGVLIHGFGRQGKSSLAARVANRLNEYDLVVIYKFYDAAFILNAIETVADSPEAQAIINQYKEAVFDNPAELRETLTQLLEGPFREAEKDEEGVYRRRPLLLVIDDFEQALEEPEKTGRGRHRVKSQDRDSIQAVIEAFANSETRSRLLFTSRREFELFHNNKNLAEKLFTLHLPPMNEGESLKQAAAKAKISRTPAILEKGALIERCIAAARGNPGLQSLLFSLVLNVPQAAERALSEMERFAKEGIPPEEEELRKFLENLAIDEILSLLTPAETLLLRAATLFEMPVPLNVCRQLAGLIGTDSDGDPEERLVGFGVWEVFEDLVNRKATALALNALTRPKLKRLSPEEETFLARKIIQPLYRAWGGEKSERRPYAADYELARLALLAENREILQGTAGDALEFAKTIFPYPPAAEFAKALLRGLEKNGGTIPLHLLRKSGEICQSARCR